MNKKVKPDWFSMTSFERNALVAEKVMGWKRETRRLYAGASNVKGWGFNQHLDRGHRDRKFVSSPYEFQGYSTDIRAAFEVVETIASKGFVFFLSKNELPSWRVKFQYYIEIFETSGDNLPEAICLAALEVMKYLNKSNKKLPVLD